MKIKAIVLGIALFIALSTVSVSAHGRPYYRGYGYSRVYVGRPYYPYRPYRRVVFVRRYCPAFGFTFVSGPVYSGYYVRHRHYCRYPRYYYPY